MANPMGSFLTAAMMLEHLGFDAAARAVETAVVACVNADRTTADIGGPLGTREVGDALLGEFR